MNRPDFDNSLRSIGIVLLAKPVQPVGNYLRLTQNRRVLYISGHGPRNPDGSLVLGKLGDDMNAEAGYRAARLAGIAVLSSIQHELGTLNVIKKVLKVTCYVCAVESFRDHPKVANGCSDLFVEVFGDCGRHARSAIGVSSLPNGIPVEIEAIFSLATIQDDE